MSGSVAQRAQMPGYMTPGFNNFVVYTAPGFFEVSLFVDFVAHISHFNCLTL